jgi:hypothetical protein
MEILRTGCASSQRLFMIDPWWRRRRTSAWLCLPRNSGRGLKPVQANDRSSGLLSLETKRPEVASRGIIRGTRAHS